MSFLEDRVGPLEARFEGLARLVQDLIPQIRAAAQTARNAYGQYQPTGSSGGGFPVFCVLTSTLAASGVVGSGTPSSVSSQTVQKISGGAWVSVSTGATIYNGSTNSIASGKTAICIANDDGSYSAVGVAC
jgi:hypothetical protein